MRVSRPILAAAAIALAAGSAAYARQPEGPVRGPTGDLDRSSVEQRAGKSFDRMDANKDGVLNAADREAHQKARFDRVDTNGDGAISPEEFGARHHDRGHPQAADDGQPQERMRHRMGHRGHRMGHFGGHGGMIQADADKDGAISKAEFQSAALTRFDSADANKDGTITADERKARWDQMRERFREKRGGPPAPQQG